LETCSGNTYYTLHTAGVPAGAQFTKKQQNFAKYQLLNFLQELLPEAALHCSSIVLQNLVQNPFQKDDANINTLLEGA
jgi:hypothetical protein